jgi:hypothetical protein
MALTQTTVGAINQILAMDGTAAIKDAIHDAVFTMTGGVGGAWPGDDSNFQLPHSTGLLGSHGPVIAQATDNLLADEDASFEGNTVGNWLPTANASLAVDATQGWHGSHCLKETSTLGVGAGSYISELGITALCGDVAVIASARVKAGNAAAVGETVNLRLWGAATGNTDGTAVTLTTSWQSVTATKTFAGDGGGRKLYLRNASAVDVDTIFLWDAFQLESGSVQTPFALNSRTASTMKIATPFTAGSALSIMCVVNTPWVGSSAVAHQIFDTYTAAGGGNGVRIFHDGGNNLGLFIYLNGSTKFRYGNISAIWPANTNHVVIATADAANTQQLFVDGTALVSSVGAFGREASLNANTFIGTDASSATPLNGSILCAIWSRVLSAAEITALSAPATWAGVIDLPTITVTGLDTGNAVRLYDAAGNIHASAVEVGGTATLTHTLD